MGFPEKGRNMNKLVSVAENTTEDARNVTGNTFDYESEFWFCTGFSVPLAIGALYLCLTQILFCIYKAGCRMKVKGNGTKHPHPKNSQNKHAFVLNCMSAFAATCAFLRAGVDFRLTYGKYNDFGCDLSIKFKLVNYVFSLLSIYLVLWLRQRIFYEHPRLKHLSSKLIRFVSWSMSVVIVAGVIVTSVFFFGVGRYLGTPYGCVPQKGPFTTIRWIILIGCTTMFQICLLTLFIYPLVKHRSNVKTGAGTGKKNIIIPLIRRAAITSFLCVASDIGFALLILLMKRKIVTMSTFVYDVNIVFNAVCMVLSFPDWRVRLMPWKITKEEIVESDYSTEGLSRTGETNIQVTSTTV